VDDSIRVQQIEKLKQVKSRRDNEKVKAGLARSEQAAKRRKQCNASKLSMP
jgi:methylmalonyl-CoA mutase N-terminal domain/subunit